MTAPSQKAIAVEFLTLIVAGKIREAYERHAAAGLRHHNPYFAGNADALLKGMEDDEARNPGKRLDVQAALEDGDRVAVHSRLTRKAGDPGIAVVHLFRFSGGKIVELWDVAQLVPETVANEHGMF
jgi:predicted SnoaL-like aldol condensation-catalyzing enzyme